MYLSLSQFSECLSVFSPKEEKKYLLSLFSCKCPTLCTPVDCSQPGFPVLHYLPEFIQTLVHWVGDAIQPSHPLSPPSPPALNLSQHQGLFQWAGSLHQVAKVLQLQLQHQSFQHSGFWFPLGLTGLISLLSKGLSRAFSNATIWKHQFFDAQPYLWSNSHILLLLPST